MALELELETNGFLGRELPSNPGELIVVESIVFWIHSTRSGVNSVSQARAPSPSVQSLLVPEAVWIACIVFPLYTAPPESPSHIRDGLIDFTTIRSSYWIPTDSGYRSIKFTTSTWASEAYVCVPPYPMNVNASPSSGGSVGKRKRSDAMSSSTFTRAISSIFEAIKASVTVAFPPLSVCRKSPSAGSQCWAVSQKPLPRLFAVHVRSLAPVTESTEKKGPLVGHVLDQC